MLGILKPHVERQLDPLVRRLAYINPNILTVLGSIPPLFFFVFVVLKIYTLALLFFVGNIFDMVDGAVARKHGKVTAFGGFLDSTLDRVSDFVIISAFAFGEIVRWEIVAPLLMFSFLISYARSRIELASNGKLKADVGIVERTERLIVIFLALVVYMLAPYLSILGLNIAEWIFVGLLVFSVVTFGQRVMFGYRKL